MPCPVNISLQWHGFLAPGELPRELASLVLMVTLSIPDAIATRRQDMTVLSSPPSTPRDARCPPETCRPQTTGAAFANDNTEHSQSTASLCSILEENSAGGGCRDDTIEFTAEAVPPQLPPPSLRPSLSPLSALPVKGQYQGHRSNWALDCFDDRLACPSVLVSDVHVLMRSSYRNKLEVLVRRSAFVVPGREELALFALDALREKRYLLFLVAMLPVLEHGLRCIFSCANDSPGHLFAQVHQYYSTLDGVSAVHLQRASCCPVATCNRILRILRCIFSLGYLCCSRSENCSYRRNHQGLEAAIHCVLCVLVHT